MDREAFKPSRDPTLFLSDIHPFEDLESKGLDSSTGNIIQQLRVQAMFRNTPGSTTQLYLLAAADELERLSAQ